MRNNPTVSPIAASVELVLDNFLTTLDFTSIFGRTAPVEIDLGCGDGAFITALARENPARNFLGIERLVGRVRSTCRKAAKENLNNLRVLRMEIGYAVRYLVPAQSVSVFHLLFPDPWPKTRHHRRRIVTAEFVQSINAALVPGGSWRIGTDQPDYFAQISRLCSAIPALAAIHSDTDLAYPPSTFGQRFRHAGLTIHSLHLQKTVQTTADACEGDR